MYSIESIVSILSALPYAVSERRHAKALFADRLYLALGPTGQPELFFRGPRESFEGLRIGRSLSWGEYRISETDQSLPALVVRTTATESGLRAMAHIAYEARRILIDSPDIRNTGLLERLRAFLDLVLRDRILTPEEQIGLIGELQFLHELLAESTENAAERSEALGSWFGCDSSLRDFYNTPVAVEVKSSASGHRHVVALNQLELAEDEETLVLCSVRVSRDFSAPVKLPQKVQAVEDLLMEPELKLQFREKLGRYGSAGYGLADRPQYELEPGFFIERVELRRIVDSTPILRKTSFREGQPPSSVSSIRYTLDVQGIPMLALDDKQRLFARLVGRRN